ncbi:ATP-binding protein [Tistrella mobilis]|uniref:ATP-binding protein n=1 Tax=Tistrella mobilis TaxID=171437 RepID=UPI000C099158|nr:ATP-binding protein [Tistrella sp.]
MRESEGVALVEEGGTDLPPVAPVLMESLRAVGYSTPAAIADLVDNSITANASSVSIRFTGGTAAFVAIIDDGEGMSDSELVAAMRFGSRDPREKRPDGDLGRFGLGMKTASLSQCRRMTVASLKEGELAIRAWDLDECESRRAWWLQKPTSDELVPDALATLATQGHGTAVIWEKLDRLYPVESTSPLRQLEMAMEGVADHLAMVFHRFLSGEMAGPFTIDVNGRPLPVLDPFLGNHPRGQSLHTEKFTIGGHDVVVTPYVLPFPSRMGATEMDRVGGRESLKTAHGFYIYRGGRLMVPGGWYRIVPSDELIRLARIKVDVPIELDHLWKVDVRKTMAEPPFALRPNLKRIVGAVTNRSKAVYKHRGVPVETDRVSLWERHELRGGAVTWRINRAHPILQAMLNGASSVIGMEQVYRLLEDSVPVHDIYVHVSNDLPVGSGETEMTEVELETLATTLLGAFAEVPEMRRTVVERLHLTDPFSRYPDMAQRIMGKLRQ